MHLEVWTRARTLPVEGAFALPRKSWVTDGGTFLGGFECRTRAGAWNVRRAQDHVVLSHETADPCTWSFGRVTVDTATIAIVSDAAKTEFDEHEDAAESFALDDIDEALFGSDAMTAILSTPGGNTVFVMRVGGDGRYEVATALEGEEVVAFIVPL